MDKIHLSLIDYKTLLQKIGFINDLEEYCENNMHNSNKENVTQSKMLEMVKSGVLIVGSVDNQGTLSVSSNPAFHYSSQSARAECMRLANLYPGKAFVFMKLSGAELVPATRISI